VVPFGFDQYDNAERLVRLGVARQLPATRYTAQTAAEQLNELLSANSYKERATDLARLIREEDGAGKVLRIVDEVLQAR
jgi:rhamnosyltransferase subunit B